MLREGAQETPEIVDVSGLPQTTVGRLLEDLAALELVRRVARGTGQRANTWELDTWTSETMEAIDSPETSVPLGRDSAHGSTLKDGVANEEQA
ncbi:MAG: hypothetical protein ACR2MC_01080 [Actinomycetota bacterium]